MSQRVTLPDRSFDLVPPAEALHVGKPNVGDVEEFISKVREILNRRWFTNNGPVVQEFESALCQYIGVRHCIPVANATLGLSLLAKEFGEAGEVIVPSFTFIATAHAMRWHGLTPVFCDIDPVTHNIDAERVEALIGPQTRGILGVHMWGRPCEVERLEEIAQRRNLKLFFDAAHAFDCTRGGRMIGNFGNAEVFSFHATKFFNTFEGGAIATNDDALAKRLRLAMNFGFAGIDRIDSLGINAKMNEVSAAMGLVSLASLGAFIEQNRANYRNYCAEFDTIPGITVQRYSQNERANYQYIVVEVDPVLFGSTRDALAAYLHSHNVLVRKYFTPPCHRAAPYRDERVAALLLPHTDRLSERVLCFPNGTGITSADISRITRLIRAFREPSTENNL